MKRHRPCSLALFATLCVLCSGAQADPVAGSEATVSLSLSLQEPTTSNSAPVFLVEFYNGSDSDLILNLGIMLANGRRQFPVGLQFFLKGPSGSEDRLIIMPPEVAGRVDDFLVPLRAGSAYSMRIRIDDLFDYTNVKPVELRPGYYSIRAKYISKEIRYVNSGSEFVRGLIVWTGTLDSNALAFDVIETVRQ